MVGDVGSGLVESTGEASTGGESAMGAQAVGEDSAGRGRARSSRDVSSSQPWKGRGPVPPCSTTPSIVSSSSAGRRTRWMPESRDWPSAAEALGAGPTGTESTGAESTVKDVSCGSRCASPAERGSGPTASGIRPAWGSHAQESPGAHPRICAADVLGCAAGALGCAAGDRSASRIAPKLGTLPRRAERVRRRSAGRRSSRPARSRRPRVSAR